MYTSCSVTCISHLRVPSAPETAGPGSILQKVHLTAISAFHPGASGRSVFANPMVGWFLKGLEQLYPQIRQPVPVWDLNLVLSKLMGAPFEPLATCSLLYLPWKVAFLVAITSARRVSELKALTSDPPYTVSHRDKLQLRPHPAFLPKVVSHFHTSQDIFLPVFYCKPHASSREQRLHSGCLASTSLLHRARQAIQEVEPVVHSGGRPDERTAGLISKNSLLDHVMHPHLLRADQNTYPGSYRTLHKGTGLISGNPGPGPDTRNLQGSNLVLGTYVHLSLRHHQACQR